MFSNLQPGDELVFGIPTASQPDEILNDLTADHTFEESINIMDLRSKSNCPKKLDETAKFGLRESGRESRDDCSIKKVMRRDIERKTRQEMSNLYSSLRLLLPLERIKGKRSIYDQTQEALNYIKYMEKHIEELRLLRDKRQKLSKFSGTKFESSTDNHNLPNRVMVNLLSNRVEILIISGSKTSEFGLSGILAELLERELEVVSCVSTKTKEETFLHTIQAEARDVKTLDASALQESLTRAIN